MATAWSRTSWASGSSTCLSGTRPERDGGAILGALLVRQAENFHLQVVGIENLPKGFGVRLDGAASLCQFGLIEGLSTYNVLRGLGYSSLRRPSRWRQSSGLWIGRDLRRHGPRRPSIRRVDDHRREHDHPG